MTLTEAKAREIVKTQETQLNGATRFNTQTISEEYNYVFAKGFLSGIEQERERTSEILKARKDKRI